MTKLTQLATQMRQIVDNTGAAYCHRKLSRGLELVLQRTDRGYRLALGRTDTAPSDTEIERSRTHLDRTGAAPCRMT